MRWLIALLAAADPSGPPAPRPPATRDAPCPVGGDEIVVCGTMPGGRSPFRLPPTGPTAEDSRGLPRAALDLGGGKRLSVETDQRGFGGFTSNRAMIRLKVPLGRRR